MSAYLGRRKEMEESGEGERLPGDLGGEEGLPGAGPEQPTGGNVAYHSHPRHRHRHSHHHRHNHHYDHQYYNTTTTPSCSLT